MIPSDPINGKTTGVQNQTPSTAPSNAPFVAPTRPGSAEPAQPTGAKPKTEAIGQKEFLTLLIHQLQNQDPLNPMDNQEFAVQLAQFTSLEQLISINSKLDQSLGGNATSVGTMASFLGHEVVLGDGPITVQDGKGQNISVTVPDGTQSLRVDFVDSSGVTVGSKVMEDASAGRRTLTLSDLNLPDGEYDVRVKSVSASGQFTDLDPKVTGTVEGFVLEPEPMLLIGGQQVPLSDVKEVHTKAG